MLRRDIFPRNCASFFVVMMIAMIRVLPLLLSAGIQASPNLKGSVPLRANEVSGKEAALPMLIVGHIFLC